MQGAQMWKPQVTPFSQARATPHGPVVTSTSLSANEQEFRTVSNKYNSKAAPFQIGNSKMVNPKYNSPVGIYSDDAIAETLSAQAEVLGQGVIGVNFMKNQKAYESDKSDVLKMVQEMDSAPRAESPGIVVMCGSPSIGIPHESPVQGHSFKLLERYLGEDPTHSPAVSPGSCTVLKPGENICSACGSLIVGVFVRIKNKNLHEKCFKCATCGMSLKNKGYYHVNDKAYCDVHAASAARQNAPGPNFEPITVGPGSPLPPGALTTPQALASRFSPQSPISPRMQPPSPASLYRPPAGGVKIMPSIPTPAPYKPGPELLLKECDLPPTSPAAQQKSYEAAESAVKISTETKKTTLESMSIVGDHVSIYDEELKSNTYNGSDLAEDRANQSPLKIFAEEKDKAIEQISDEHKVILSETSEQTKNLLDCQNNAEMSLLSHSQETMVSPDLKSKIESPISTANKINELQNRQSDSLLKQVDSYKSIQSEVNTSFNKSVLSQSTVIGAQNNATPLSASSAIGLPDLNVMQIGSNQNSASLDYKKQESKMASSSSQQYTASSSCYQSFGIEQKSETSKSGMIVTGNNAPPVSSVLSAPFPVSPVVAPTTKHVSAPFPGTTGASNQNFGAPSGDINVRAHIPKKGPAPPSSFLPEVPKPPSMMPSSPLFDLPKPSMPPGAGPQRGVAIMPGQRSAPKRGRGIINPASISRVPMCATCQRQIRGPFVSALGKTWCPDCFICATSNCRKQLINMGFVEEKGGLHCEDCYERFLAPPCGKCDKKIKGDCLNAISKHFHPECFCCAYCGKIFGSGAFYLEDGLPYCETDWNDLFTTKCIGCKFPIEAGDRWVEALNNNYHSQCFKCSKCHKSLEGQSFVAKAGKPYCKSHAQRGF